MGMGGICIDRLAEFFLSANLWASLILIVAVMSFWSLIRRFVQRQINRYNISGKRENNIHIIMMTVKIIIVFVVIVAVLQINGINVSSLVTGLGVVSIVVGFAVQDLLKDLMMGTNIIWDNFFKTGDVVLYHGIVGRIEYFNIKVTKIYDINTGNILTVSNRNISEIELVSDWLDIIVPASYTVDADTMRKVCMEICNKISLLENASGCDFLGTDEFADSMVNYRLRIHCMPELKPTVRRSALGIIQDVYKSHDLSIPYPHMDVNIIKQSLSDSSCS